MKKVDELLTLRAAQVPLNVMQSRYRPMINQSMTWWVSSSQAILERIAEHEQYTSMLARLSTLYSERMSPFLTLPGVRFAQN